MRICLWCHGSWEMPTRQCRKKYRHGMNHISWKTDRFPTQHPVAWHIPAVQGKFLNLWRMSLYGMSNQFVGHSRGSPGCNTRRIARFSYRANGNHYVLVVLGTTLVIHRRGPMPQDTCFLAERVLFSQDSLF